jgi:membrane fusion protein, multidrug efflux system
MRRRMTLMLVALTTFIVGVGSVKYGQIQAAVRQSASFQPPPEAVTTLVARPERWGESLSAIGTVAAVQGVTVAADLPGIVERIAFESGRMTAAGAVLVQLDTRQEQAQLAAAAAQLDLARLSFERLRGLRDQGVVPQAQYDQAVAEQAQAEARVGEIRATIERKTIRAPFAGLLGIRQVNLGQYLQSGEPVVPLQSLSPIHVDFAVPQQELGALRAGAEVQVTAEGMQGAEPAGRITAFDSVVDAATRNIHVQATLDNPAGALRPGMFVEARVLLDRSTPVVPIPASAISYAPYGDSVFIVETMRTPSGEEYRGVRQQFVKVGAARGDQVALLSGVKPGDEVVTSGAFKLRNGAAVLVANDVQPGNDVAPNPRDS